MMPASTLPQDYFDNMYANDKDPWKFETSDYEKLKYQATVDALPHQNYQNAFEIGCSIGVLTMLLAGRCNKLLSVDASELPLQNARKRLEHHYNVELKKMSIPKDFPDAFFDLIVVSEVGYYLSMEDLALTQQLILKSLNVQGQLLLVHWTPFVADYPLTGDQVHSSFLALAGPDKRLIIC